MANSRHAGWIILALALATRVAAISVAGVRGDDSDGNYLLMARELLQGNGLSFVHGDFGRLYSWLPPGMCFIYLPFLLLFNNIEIPMRIFFLGLTLASYLVFFRLGQRLYPRPYAFLATIILIAYPPQWLWSTRINTHTLACQLTIVSLFFLFKVWEKRSWTGAFFLGALWAFVGLTRGEYLPGIVVLALAGFFYFKSRRDAIICGLMLGLGCAAAMAPWVIRNYRIHDRFVLIATNYGDNFWIAYNKDYKFSGAMVPQPPELFARLQAEPHEVKRADMLVEDAKRYIRENPGRFVKTLIGNTLNFWRPWISPSAASLPENILYVASYLPLFLLFLIGLFHVPWGNAPWMAVVGFVAYKVAIHIPFYTIVLQREDMMPLIILIAVLGLAPAARANRDA